MSDSLKERLRRLAPLNDAVNGVGSNEMIEAAARIEELEEELKAKDVTLQALNCSYQATIAKLEKEIGRLRAELVISEARIEELEARLERARQQIGHLMAIRDAQSAVLSGDPNERLGQPFGDPAKS